MNPGCEGESGDCPGGWHWWDTAPTQTPSPSFSRDSPRATSATAAQGPAAVPRSSWQHRGAGSGQDTTEGQRGAFWEAGTSVQTTHIRKPCPSPSGHLPSWFWDEVAAFRLVWAKGKAGSTSSSPTSLSYHPFSARREGERSGLASPSLGAACAFPLIFLPAWPQPSEMKEWGEANWLRGIKGGGVHADGGQHQPQRPL